MRTLADDEEDEVKPSGASKSRSNEQPAWMKQLLEKCKEWLAILPTVRKYFGITPWVNQHTSCIDICNFRQTVGGEPGSALPTLLP